MTENQEKELFTTLARLVSGVNQIQSDVREIKGTQNEHTVTLAEHSQILGEHSEKLELLVARTDSIAEAVMAHETRFNAIERAVDDLGGKIH